MRYKTVTEEIFEEGVAEGRAQGLMEGCDKILNAVKKLGVLTEEQLALLTKQAEIE